MNDPVEIMIAYLKLKVEKHDWHAVADAAMDIRELISDRRVAQTPSISSKIEYQIAAQENPCSALSGHKWAATQTWPSKARFRCEHCGAYKIDHS